MRNVGGCAGIIGCNSEKRRASGVHLAEQKTGNGASAQDALQARLTGSEAEVTCRRAITTEVAAVIFRQPAVLAPDFDGVLTSDPGE